MDSEDFGVILSTLVVAVMGVMIGIVIGESLVSGDIYLSQETADDICINLTNNTAATGQGDSTGKLICETPSFDSTQNIIIKPNNQLQGGVN
jgi:hypothetical protein